MLKIVAASAVAILTASWLLTANAAPAEIYLVRHAEKLKSADQDPPLSPCGLAQAEAMAALLPASLSDIYYTDYQRTRQTAQQVKRTQSAATLRSYNAADLAPLATTILQQDNTVLVVGHSNTTPALIQLLGLSPAPAISEHDYGVLYQLKQSGPGYVLQTYRIKQPGLCAASAQ